MTLRVGRIVWWIVLAVIGLVTLFAQLDRQARYSPAFAALVPDPFLSFGQGQLAAGALSEGTPSQALDPARELISRRPVPAEHLAILAGAHARNGNEASSLTALELASRRGWRGASTQLALLELAIAAENGTEAARRFSALLATDGNEEALIAAAPRVFALPQARMEMTRLLGTDPRWNERFHRVVPQIVDREAYREIWPE